MAEGSRLVPSGARSQVRGKPSGSYNEITGRGSGTSLNGYGNDRFLIGCPCLQSFSSHPLFSLIISSCLSLFYDRPDLEADAERTAPLFTGDFIK